MNDTTWLMMWRVKDGDVWNEAGQHPTLEEAAKAAHALRDQLGIQAVVCEWRNATLCQKA